ncbi:MAG: LysR family transcriptional regulator [Paracoccus sp. (in: a-proteobacteria)]|nr:LysR family transcriptional regulator [Paracoccus sp. (in: a-proteobacteria)]
MRYDLNQIETFLAVLETGTVTAAAARLNLSKSVVSTRIADFEAILGAALFRRNAGRITPTEAALRLAERLRPALAALTAATDSAAWGGHGGMLTGSLAIAAPMSFGTMVLAPVLARFAASHPGLDLRIDFDDRARDLAREGFDLGIRVGRSGDSALIGKKLCEEQQIVVASPGYLDRHGRPDTPAGLVTHQAIGYTHMADAALWQFRQGGRWITPRIASRLVMNNGEAIRDMVIAGLGLAILPRFIVAGALDDGRLVRLLPDAQTRALAVMAVWPPVSPMPVKLRTVVDFLADGLS